MPIEIINAENAYNALKSRYHFWPTEDRERLCPCPHPEVFPSFEISPSDKIFTMGSCFAREVDNALSRLGFNIISRDSSVSNNLYKYNDLSLYNKYNVYSIWNELHWSLEIGQNESFDDLFYKNIDGQYYDSQLGGRHFCLPYNEIVELRKRYMQSVNQIKYADIIILTLGLSEVWFDTKKNLYLNITPPFKYIDDWQDRFELHVLSYDDVKKCLIKIFNLLNKFSERTCRILITVSPIPLLATFRNMDSIVANTYSKSLLRSVIDDVIRQYKNIDYFCSFEIAHYTDIKSKHYINKNDLRHIRSDFVDKIINYFISKYIPSVDIDLHQKLIFLFKNRDFSTIVNLIKNKDRGEIYFPKDYYRIGLAFLN